VKSEIQNPKSEVHAPGAGQGGPARTLQERLVARLRQLPILRDSPLSFGACRSERRRLALLADGLLADVERAAAEKHLLGCPACQRYFREIRMLGRALRTAPARVPSMLPRATWSAHWKQAIRAGDQGKCRDGHASGLEWTAFFEDRRPAVAGLLAMWALALFFRLSGPTPAQEPPRSTAITPREALTALQAQRRQPAPWQQADRAGDEPGSADRPPATSPRSQGLGPALAA
jgi:hypothetical protein